MAIFAVLQTEKKVQVGDKTRLDASHSFSSKGEITKIEVKPHEDEEFFEINLEPEMRFFDWIYSVGEHVTAEVRVTVGEGEEAETATGLAEFEVVTEAEDALFSDDSDLLGPEPGISNYLPDGHSTFNYAHREAQTQIMDAINRQVGDQKSKWLTSLDVVEVKQVAEWSKFLTLTLIFESLVNAADDVHSKKAERYRTLADLKKNLSFIALDLNGDGVIDDSEKKTSFGSVRISRS